MAGDAHFDKVVLLLHCDGAADSTTFTDSSIGAKTVTAYGGAKISATDPIFGSGSGLFDGTNAYLQLADSADWAFGSAPFTVELFIRFASVSGAQRIIGQANSGSTDLGWQVQKSSGNVIVCNGGGTFPVLTGTTSVTAGTLYHVALTGDGATARLFLNGILQASGAYTSVADSGSVLGIGQLGAYAANRVNGLLDEIRVTKGVARYTTNFTPPAEPFGGANVVLSGLVTDASNSPAARLIRAYREDTGALAGSATSDAGSGAYSIVVDTSGAHTLNAYPAAGESLPTLTLRGVIPV